MRCLPRSLLLWPNSNNAQRCGVYVRGLTPGYCISFCYYWMPSHSCPYYDSCRGTRTVSQAVPPHTPEATVSPAPDAAPSSPSFAEAVALRLSGTKWARPSPSDISDPRSNEAAVPRLDRSLAQRLKDLSKDTSGILDSQSPPDLTKGLPGDHTHTPDATASDLIIPSASSTASLAVKSRASRPIGSLRGTLASSEARDTFDSFMSAVLSPQGEVKPSGSAEGLEAAEDKLTETEAAGPDPEDWMANLPGIVDLHARTHPTKTPKFSFDVDFWRGLPVTSPFNLPTAYNFDIYMKAVEEYQRSTGFYASVIPHLATAVELGHRHLTSVQLSRIAARAVRFAANNDQFGDAFDIVESLCKSCGIPPPPGERRVPKASVRLKTPASPLLSYHALVHQLVRVGAANSAGYIVGVMMKRGLDVRSGTLVAVVRALARMGHKSPPLKLPSATPAGPSRVQFVEQGFALLKPSVHRSQFTGVRTAFVVASHAFSRKHTEIDRLYAAIADASIDHGEMIIASLLYHAMLRYARQQYTQDQPETRDLQMRVHDKLLSAVRRAVRDEDPSFSPQVLQENYQALLNVVVTHEDSRFSGLRIGMLGSLFNTLAVCKPSDDEAWVYRAGAFTRVNVYAYVQSFALNALYGVLNRNLTWDRDLLEDDIAALATDELPFVPHGLSRLTYRSLIQYACHVLNSPFLAIELLEHMALEHEPRRDGRLAVILTRYGLHRLAGALSPRALDFISWNPARIHHSAVVAAFPWGGHGGDLFDAELKVSFLAPGA